MPYSESYWNQYNTKKSELKTVRIFLLNWYYFLYRLTLFALFCTGDFYCQYRSYNL